MTEILGKLSDRTGIRRLTWRTCLSALRMNNYEPRDSPILNNIFALHIFFIAPLLSIVFLRLSYDTKKMGDVGLTRQYKY